MIVVQQEGNAHPTLALLPRVMEGDGTLSLAVLAAVLKLKWNNRSSQSHESVFIVLA